MQKRAQVANTTKEYHVEKKVRKKVNSTNAHNKKQSKIEQRLITRQRENKQCQQENTEKQKGNRVKKTNSAHSRVCNKQK